MQFHVAKYFCAEFLQGRLKRYNDGFTINDEVIKNTNTLLVINGRIGKKLPQKSASNNHVGRRLTVVEAGHLFATSRVR